MIIDTSNSALSTNLPNGTGVNFTIAATAQAFQILSSSIYEHKIAAVVRELCTNAFDSHTESGKEDTPFLVVLPTKFHPYFEVEDFGIGMSMDDAVRIYTVYFASTKRASNEVAGGLGIGAKSVFAYTKQFTVRIRKDGVENTAMIYMDASGCPRLDVISTVETDKCNGVRVTVPVQEKDFYTFIEEARFYMSFYPVTPKTNIEVSLVYPDIRKSIENVSMIHSKRGGHSDAAMCRGDYYALMGPVPYPVNILSLVKDSSTYNILRHSASEHGSMFAKFEIGELHVAASRESLSLDEETTAVLVDRFSEACADMRTRMEEAANRTDVHPVEAYCAFTSQFPSSFVREYSTAPNALYRAQKIWRLKHARSYNFNFWGGKSKPRVTNYTFSAISLGMRAEKRREDAVVVVSVDCNKRMVYDLIRNMRFDFVYERAISESMRGRLERIIGAPVKVVKYSDLYAAHLEERRKNRAQGVRGTYAKNSVQASGFNVSACGDVTPFKAKRVELDDDVYCVSGVDAYSMYLGARGHISTDEMKDVLGVIAKITNKSFTIIRKNGQNESRVTKYDVKKLESLLDEVDDDHHEEIARSLLISDIQEFCQNYKLRILVEADSVFLDDDVKSAARKVYDFQTDRKAEVSRDVISFFEKAKELHKKQREELIESAYSTFDSDLVEELVERNYWIVNSSVRYGAKLTKSRMLQCILAVKAIDSAYQEAQKAASVDQCEEDV